MIRASINGLTITNFRDENGKEFILEADGIAARAIQHENDHLDGVLFVDHLSPLKKDIFRKKYRQMLEQSRVDE